MSRCPRCQGENDVRAARCARCGAPLLLREEPAPRPLDRPLDLDRRLGRPPHPPAPAPRPPGASPPRPLQRSAPGEPLPGKPLGVADSHWELGRPPRPAASPARPALTPPWPVAPGGAPAAPPETAPPAAAARPPAAAPLPASPRPPRDAPRPPHQAPEAAWSAAPAPADLDPDVLVDAIEVHRRRAATWKRLASWAVDALLLGLVAAPVIWLVLAAAGPSAGATDIDALLALAVRQGRFLVPTLAFVALASAVYSALSVALMGATPGKRLLGLEVVGRDGRRPSPRRAVARAALTLLSFAFLGLGCLLALFTRSGRALHDFLAGTLVVERDRA